MPILPSCAISGRIPVIDLRNVLFILTALGSAILGMPDAFTQFGVNARSATGAAVCFILVAAIITAARHRVMPSIALPAGIFTFGLCSIAAIAVARQYLGNWHLVYAIPAVTASYAAAYTVFREVRSLAAAQLSISAATILLLGLIAYYNGFVQYGPQYNAYIHSIEQYARTYLANPTQAKPFPGTGGWDLDADMVWFLASRKHQVFAESDRAILSATRVPVPQAKFVIARNSAVSGAAAHALVVASLPADETAAGLILRAGNADVVLRKTDPRLVAQDSCTRECFSAWLATNQIPEDGAAQLSAVGFARPN